MENLRKLILIGGAGTSSDVLALIAGINRDRPSYEVLGLLDDALSAGSLRFGVPVLGALADCVNYQDAWFVDCLGSPRSFQQREELLERCGLSEMQFETLIHPSVVLSEDTQIGPGCILYPNVVVLSNVRLGQHVTILSGSVLNHDVEIGDWSIVGSGVMLSGSVKIGEACYLGAASSVREGTSIANGCLVGMGAAVIKDVAPGTTVIGVPARVLRAVD